MDYQQATRVQPQKVLQGEVVSLNFKIRSGLANLNCHRKISFCSLVRGDLWESIIARRASRRNPSRNLRGL